MTRLVFKSSAETIDGNHDWEALHIDEDGVVIRLFGIRWRWAKRKLPSGEWERVARSKIYNRIFN